MEISPSERHKVRHKCMPLTKRVDFEHSNEFSATSRSSSEIAQTSFDSPSTKSLPSSIYNDDHDGSGFKRKSGDGHIGGAAFRLQTKFVYGLGTGLRS